MSVLSILSDLGAIYPTVFTTDFLRYVIGAGGVYLIVNLLLSRHLAGRKIREQSPPLKQIRREIQASFRTVLIFALNGTLIVYGAGFGVFTIYTDAAAFGWWYLAFSTLVLIVLHDSWFYWAHRLLHYPPLFRLFHRLHHLSYNPTPFTSYSFGAGEAVANAIYLPLTLLLLPVHPLALLIFVIHMMLRNAIGHCGYEIFPANRQRMPLFDWVTTVTHHDLHHSHAGYNMGLYFTWWDRWMGTEYPHYHAEFARVSRPVDWWPYTTAVAILVVSVILGFSLAAASESADQNSEPRRGIDEATQAIAGSGCNRTSLHYALSSMSDREYPVVVPASLHQWVAQWPNRE
ncbi:MAG: sterol desaturase family protein [Rhodobacteraceae bacterium]|nr:sterol desaturase family protein [Paracoccaceae bacterium]